MPPSPWLQRPLRAPAVAVALLLAFAALCANWQAASAQSDCIAGPPTDSLPAELQISPGYKVAGRTPDSLLVYALAAGCRARLDLYSAPAAGEPELLGSLQGEYGQPLYANGLLYGRRTPTSTLAIIDIGLAARPALVGQRALPSGEIALSPEALYLASPAGGLYVYSLDDPSRPVSVANIPNLDARTLTVHANRLLVLSPNTLHLYSIANPLAPALQTSLPLTGTLGPPFELQTVGDAAYVMGSNSAGEPICRVVSLSPSPSLLGACPFVAGRTFVLGSYAYVNPNAGASEYLDYKLVSLATPAAPQVVGTVPVRFAQAVPFAGYAYASTHDDGLVRLQQAANGALTAAALGWSIESPGLEGTARLLKDGLLYVDVGAAGEAGDRVVRRVDVTGVRPRFVLPDLPSSHLGGQWFVDGRHLYAYSGAGLNIFDTAAGLEVGRLPLPAGERANRMVVGKDGFAWLVTSSNLYLTADLRLPAAPVFVDELGIPGDTEHLVGTQGALFAFDETTLRIFVPGADGRLSPPKSLPIEGDVREVSATTHALVVRRGSGLELLDVSSPLTPAPVSFDWGPGAIVRLLPAAGDRVAIIASVSSAQTGGAATTHLRVFELRGATPHLLATVDTGRATAIQFDGTHVVLPDLTTWRIGDLAQVWAEVPVTGAVSPQPGITYTVSLEGLSPGAGAITGQGPLCLAHTVDADATGVIDGGLPGRAPGTRAARTPLFRPQLFRCLSGEIAPGAAYTVEVSAAVAAGAPQQWEDAVPSVDGGSTWSAPDRVRRSGASWLFALPAGQAWALTGSPPLPTNLPIVRQLER